MHTYGYNKTKIEAFKLVDSLVRSKAGRIYEDVVYIVMKESGLSPKMIKAYIDDTIETGFMRKNENGQLFWSVKIDERENQLQANEGDLAKDSEPEESIS